MVPVVVVGGGVAGCAAAVAAAAGAAVTLLEARSVLGGEAVVGYHRTICGLAAIDAPAPDLLEPDLVGPWLAALASGPPFRQGRVWLWPTDDARLASASAAALVRAGVQVVTDCRVTAIAVDHGTVTGVYSGRRSWPATVLIDASGGPHLAQLLGAAIRPGVALGAWRCEVAVKLGTSRGARLAALRRLQPVVGPAPIGLTAIGPDCWQVSIDRATPPHDPSGLAAAVASALGGRPLRQATDLARRDSGGWAGSLDVDTLFTTTGGLCKAAWPVERHDRQRVVWHWPEAASYGVPIAACRPATAPEHVWVVGRGMPVTSDAIAALRVIGSQLALGAALGRHATTLIG